MVVVVLPSLRTLPDPRWCPEVIVIPIFPSQGFSWGGKTTCGHIIGPEGQSKDGTSSKSRGQAGEACALSSLPLKLLLPSRAIHGRAYLSGACICIGRAGVCMC